MEDGQKTGSSHDPQTEVSAAMGVAWIELTRLLIKSNVISKEEIQNQLTVCLDAAKKNNQPIAEKVYWALRGSLNDA